MAYILHQLLSESVQRWPEKEAVSARGRSLTYGELEERSNQLAHLLRERGVKKGDRVGLYFPKSVESIVAMIGALKAGAAYVPLDPQAPPKRVAYIVGNCGIKGLITDRARARLLAPLAPRDVEFRILTDGPAGGQETPDEIALGTLPSFPSSAPLKEQPIESDLAYILYTSGSTGEPKGVMLTHRNALTFVDWCAATFQIRPDDRLSNHAPLHFDLSVFDVYNTLQAGAAVSLVHEELTIFPASVAAFIESQRISVWYSVPSALVHLVFHGNLSARNLERLRLVLFAGEIFPMKYLRQLADIVPHAELCNLYGPTETNVCTYYRVERSELALMDRLPIGRACANTEVFAVNESQRVAGPGEVGELYVRGASVTPGYWGDPEKTAKAVVRNSFHPYLEEKVYRTGDLVRLMEDGNYDFLGRRDNMIKSRGYRIELGEIEAALYSHPQIQEAAVFAIPDEQIGNIIKAVVVTANGIKLSKVEVESHCSERLPKYMIPAITEFRDSLPKTSTGKADKTRLLNEHIQDQSR